MWGSGWSWCQGGQLKGVAIDHFCPCLQVPAILGAMDVLSSSLQLPSPSAALALLVAQPALLYDITPASIAARLQQLAVVLACEVEDARGFALQQPVSALQRLLRRTSLKFVECQCIQSAIAISKLSMC